MLVLTAVLGGFLLGAYARGMENPWLGANHFGFAWRAVLVLSVLGAGGLLRARWRARGIEALLCAGGAAAGLFFSSLWVPERRFATRAIDDGLLVQVALAPHVPEVEIERLLCRELYIDCEAPRGREMRPGVIGVIRYPHELQIVVTTTSAQSTIARALAQSPIVEKVSQLDNSSR
jgi:hypothetical protein